MDIRRAVLTSWALVRRLDTPLAAPRGLLRCALTVAAAAVLAGCGGQGAAPATPSTVTVTESSSTPAEPEPQEPIEGDVTERHYDAGAIVDVKEVAGQQVVVLDRWTVIGLDDAALARDGAPVVAHTGERFTNQNTRATYEVPVSPDVIVVVNECLPPDDPAAPPGIASSQITLEELLAMPGLDAVPLLLTYDQGQLVQVDTDAAC